MRARKPEICGGSDSIEAGISVRAPGELQFIENTEQRELVHILAKKCSWRKYLLEEANLALKPPRDTRISGSGGAKSGASRAPEAPGAPDLRQVSDT